MFRYERLTCIEKEIITKIGDDLENPPNHYFRRIKNRRKIYEKYFKSTMNYAEYEQTLYELYLKGLLSFSGPVEIEYENNIADDSRSVLEEKYKEYEEGWRGQDPFIRLTTQDERAISGIIVYNRIVQDDINANFIELKANISNLKNDFNQNNIRVFEMMGIFIALFTILVGNIGLFNNLQGLDIYSICSLVLIVNGTIFMGVYFLLFLPKILVFNQREFVKRDLFILFVPLLIILSGLIIEVVAK